MTLKMTLDDFVSYIFEIYMKNQVEWYPAHLKLKKLIFDLMTLKMTSDHGKSYISENYMKNRVEWHFSQDKVIKLKIQPPATFNILQQPPKGEYA